MEQLLTATQARQFLNIHKTTFIRLVNSGDIPSIVLSKWGDGRTLRRFKMKDLENLGKNFTENVFTIPISKKHKRKARKIT